MLKFYAPLAMLMLTLLLPGIGIAEESQAEQVLKEKGLAKRGNFWALAEEVELNGRMSAFGKLKKKLVEVQKEQAQAIQAVEQKKTLTDTYLQQRRAMNEQLGRAPNATVHNKLVAGINDLGDRIQLLERDESLDKKLQEVNSVADKISAEYTQHLLDTRALCDQLKQKYESLSEDKQIAAAIQEFNKANGKSLKLGPTSTLVSAERQLTKLEETVLSEAVAIQRERSDLWTVPVTFNGKYTERMAIDTGASIISLPWAMAKAVGLEPSASAPTIRMQMADGREVDGKRVYAESVRVGKFSVENVECVVMPEDLVNAGPLLGQSFLKNFSYKIDPSNQELVITKVELPEASRGRNRTTPRQKATK